MRLYMLPTCPYAHRAAFVLREKRVDFDVMFFEPGKRPPELEAVGPRAKSPTIFDGDVRVYDSGVVLEYLEERFPEPHLLPGALEERAQVTLYTLFPSVKTHAAVEIPGELTHLRLWHDRMRARPTAPIPQGP